MGLLIFVWGIHTELQNCMHQTAHGPCLSQSLLFICWIDSLINAIVGFYNIYTQGLWRLKRIQVWSYGIFNKISPLWVVHFVLITYWTWRDIDKMQNLQPRHTFNVVV